MSGLKKLAALPRNTGKVVEAEPLQRKPVPKHINMYGEEGLETAAVYSGLSLLFKHKGDLAEAGTYYRKALTIFEHMPFCMTIKSRIIL